MSVGIVGSGPAADAVAAALADVGVETAAVDVSAIGDGDLAVVVDEAGAPVFEQANERALAGEAPWIGVELGGVAGAPVADAAVAGFAPGAGCYACLEGRVASNLEGDGVGGPGDPPAHTRRFAGAVAGRDAARFLAGDADIAGRLVLAPFAERTFLPLPNCDCETHDRRHLDRSYVDRTVEESLARAERAIDEIVGIVQEVGEAESFPVPYYLSQACETGGFSDASAARDAAGVAGDWNSAFMKALGEAMERYCAGVYRTATFERGTPSDVPDAVDPAGFVTRSAPDGEAVAWVRGQELATGDRAMLPAEFVHYPPPKQRYRPAITTGLGLGNSTVEAILSGLYEVIERDASMIAWHSSFDPLGLAIDDPTFEAIAARASAEDLAVTPLLLTLDVDVPVVAVAVHREEWPRLALGSSANLDVTAAARSALCEALQNWLELRGMGRDGAADALGAIGDYADMPDSVASFVRPESTIPADAAGPDGSPQGPEELEMVLERLDSAGLDAYAARTTTRDVEQLGFEAVRAVVPAAQPLCFGDPFFGARAETVPADLGFAQDLDRDHHPFP